MRTATTDITLFKSVGNAVQDVSVAQAVYQQAKAKGKGVLVNARATTATESFTANAFRTKANL